MSRVVIHRCSQQGGYLCFYCFLPFLVNCLVHCTFGGYNMVKERNLLAWKKLACPSYLAIAVRCTNTDSCSFLSRTFSGLNGSPTERCFRNPKSNTFRSHPEKSIYRSRILRSRETLTHVHNKNYCSTRLLFTTPSSHAVIPTTSEGTATAETTSATRADLKKKTVRKPAPISRRPSRQKVCIENI